MSTLPGGCLLVRTYFGDRGSWERLIAAVQQPDRDSGYVATVTFVDDPSWAALSADELRAHLADSPETPMVCFIADDRAQHEAGWPVLAVWVLAPDPDLDTGDYSPFRVIASELAAVEANINLGNLDWDDFAGAVDEDGVYRGFKSSDRDVVLDPGKWEPTEFQAVVDHVLDPGHQPTRVAQRSNVLLADVTVDVPKDEVLRRWRDIDSGWIYAGVNPTGRTPNTYRLDHSAPQWGQDTLSMILQYQSTDIPDEVVFRVQYLRAKRAPERRDESLDEPRSLSVTVFEGDGGSTRIVVRQDRCPETLFEPLSELWATLAHRLNT